MTGQGEPHSPRLFTPGVAVLLGYVLLAGNPWLNRDLQIALSDAESVFRVAGVLLAYPSWHVDVDRVGPFLFWFANLRTLLFVALAVGGLARVPRWVRDDAGGVGLFVLTVGLTTVSAVVAALGSSMISVSLLGSREAMAYLGPVPEEFVLTQLGSAATFGVLLGLLLGAVVAMQRLAPAREKRRVNAPKSFW